MNEQVIKQVITAWESQNKRVTDFFSKYEDSSYSNPIAPGRNRPIYLLGHLIAVNDRLMAMLGLGERSFAQFDAPFLEQGDNVDTKMPSIAELKQAWEQVNKTLTACFNTMTAADWMDRHTAVSAEDFALDPSRNKLNVLLTRTIHEAYHLGQLNLLHGNE